MDASRRAMIMPQGQQIKGTLMAHLHEHKMTVTKLAALRSNSSLSASAGTSIAACDLGHFLAVAGNDGSLLLLRINPNSSKMAPQQASHLVQSSRGHDEHDDGPVVDMHQLSHDSQSFIIYAVLYGAIICWELRMPNNPGA